MPRIPFLKPRLPQVSEYEHHLRTMDENHWYTNFGPLNSEFERRILSDYFGNKGSVTTLQNCTLGLMLAVQKMKRPKARYALMPSFTFAATPQAAMWCGLEPWFVDIDPVHWSMDANKLNSAIDQLGDEVAIVISYATFGNCLDLSPYEALMHKGIPVVIDAAPAFGSNKDGQQFGQNFMGAVVFSFHATKAFGIGEGGLIYSADKNLIDALRQNSNFAFSRPGFAESLGMNAKMSEITAAVGLATLEKFPDKIKTRQKLYGSYEKQLGKAGLLDYGWRYQTKVGAVPSQFFPLLAPGASLAARLESNLHNADIEYRRYFQPHCYQQNAFNMFGHDSLATTTDIASRTISLPLWEGMTDEDIASIVCVLNQTQNATN